MMCNLGTVMGTSGAVALGSKPRKNEYDNMGIANVQLPPVSTDGVAPTVWDDHMPFAGKVSQKLNTDRPNVQRREDEVDIFKLDERDVYKTTEGQTFFHVCKALNIDGSQWRPYYNWISAHFRMGWPLYALRRSAESSPVGGN